jgi:hypothetical protein
MPVNGREPEEKDCSFRLKLTLFPYRGTVLVTHLLGGSCQEIFSNLIPLKVITYSIILLYLGLKMKFYRQKS